MKPIPVTGITISNPMTGKDMDLNWNPSPEIDVVGYNVYRGLGPKNTDVVKLNTTLILVPMFRDTVATQRINTRFYYTVTAVNSIAQESDKTDMFTFRMQATDPMVWKLNEMIRRHNLMAQFHGEDVYYFVRKTFGTRCTTCYDASQGQGHLADCPTCYGTTYVGGYVGLGLIKVVIDPPKLLMKLGTEGWMIDGRSMVGVSTYPLMKNGDIIIRKTNQRYELDSYQAYPWQGMITYQTAALTEHPPRDYQIFKIPTT
jgi:hypothetical protein